MNRDITVDGMRPLRPGLSPARLAGLALASLLGSCFLTASVGAATMYSTKNSYMGAGEFYGPGRLADSPIFDVIIRNIGFTAPNHYVTPFRNNGGAAPNVCAENELGKAPTGVLSDGITRINENVDVCSFKLNGTSVFMGIVDGGLHEGQQVAVTVDGKDGITMVMTMDFAIDLGIGKAGVIHIPFYGTTGEVTVPYSLQTQMGIEGGIDRAGSLKPGAKLRGRLGDFNGDGMLDGAIVVAGNIPIDSVFMPGAPYALIRYFETDVPYSGILVGAGPKTITARLRSTPPVALTNHTLKKPLNAGTTP